MNENNLKSCANHVRLPQESKERIIRNLEVMTQNQDETEIDNSPKRPIVRHIMTAVAACMVIAVSAGGIYYHLHGGRSSFSPGLSAIVQSSVSIEDMQKTAPDMFAALADLQLYAIPAYDRGETGICPETVSYITLTKENQEQLAELYQTIDFENPIKDYNFSSNWEDRFLLFFQYADIYYNVQTTKATDGNCYIQLMCVSPGESRGYTRTYQTEADFYDKTNALLQNPAFGSDMNIEFDKILYDNLDQVLEILFGEQNLATRFATAIVEADTKIGADAMDVYFISRENQDSAPVQYFNMNRDDFLNFWRILNQAVLGRPDLASDLKTDFMTGGDVEFIMYLEDRSYIEFWHDAVSGQVDLLFHDMPGFQDMLCIQISEEEYQNLKNALVPEEYFNTEYENMNTVLYGRIEMELMNQMFGGNAPDVNEIIQKAEQTFTNLEEAEYYFCVQDSDYLFENHHKGQYFSIPEEKQNQLAELFKNLDYSDMKKNYTDGGNIIIMYLKDANQQKSFVSILFDENSDRAYLTWHPDGKSVGDNYYLELDLDTLNQIAEILSEPEQLFNFSTEGRIFDVDDIFREIPPFGDTSRATERLMFPAYAPYYLIPDADQQAQLTELLNSQHWGEPLRPGTDYSKSQTGDGECFMMFFRMPDEAFEIRCQLSGYLIYIHDGSQDVYYNPELVSAIQDMFIPAKTVYVINNDDSFYNEPEEKIEIDTSGNYDLTVYEEILNQFNQEHGTEYQFASKEAAGSEEVYQIQVSWILAMTEDEFRNHLEEAYQNDLEYRQNVYEVKLYDTEGNPTGAGAVFFRNSKGQSYGAANTEGLRPEDAPDLIFVIGDHQQSGYLLKSDLEANQALQSLPGKEFAEWKASLPEGLVLNVYDQEGETILDTFSTTRE